MRTPLSLFTSPTLPTPTVHIFSRDQPLHSLRATSLCPPSLICIPPACLSHPSASSSRPPPTLPRVLCVSVPSSSWQLSPSSPKAPSATHSVTHVWGQPTKKLFLNPPPQQLHYPHCPLPPPTTTNKLTAGSNYTNYTKSPFLVPHPPALVVYAHYTWTAAGWRRRRGRPGQGFQPLDSRRAGWWLVVGVGWLSEWMAVWVQ